MDFIIEVVVTDRFHCNAVGSIFTIAWGRSIYLIRLLNQNVSYRRNYGMGLCSCFFCLFVCLICFCFCFCSCFCFCNGQVVFNSDSGGRLSIKMSSYQYRNPHVWHDYSRENMGAWITLNNEELIMSSQKDKAQWNCHQVYEPYGSAKI